MLNIDSTTLPPYPERVQRLLDAARLQYHAGGRLYSRLVLEHAAVYHQLAVPLGGVPGPVYLVYAPDHLGPAVRIVRDQDVACHPYGGQDVRMCMHVSAPQLVRRHLALQQEAPFGYAQRDLAPKVGGGPLLIGCYGLGVGLQQEPGGLRDAVQREEFFGAVADVCLLHLRPAHEYLHVVGQIHYKSGERVSVVVQQPQRSGGLDRMFVQIREHLLASLQTHVLKEDDGYALAAELGTLLVCLADGRVPVLAVVDEDGRVYGYVERAHAGGIAQARRGMKYQLAPHRDRDGREDVAVRVAQDVVSDGRYAGAAELALGAELGRYLRVLVELEVVVQCGKRAHAGVELPASLYTAYDIKGHEAGLAVHLSGVWARTCHPPPAGGRVMLDALGPTGRIL